MTPNGNTFRLPRSSPLDALLRNASTSHRTARPSTPSPPHHSTQRSLSPTSPLLHTHFRSSTTTLSDSNSYLDTSTISGDDSADYHRYCDNDSLYSNTSARFSGGDTGLRHPWSDSLAGGPPRASSGSTVPDGRMAQDVPTVVISPAERDESGTPGRARSLTASPTANFSRPAVRRLPLPPDEQKRQVLERNSRRPRAASPAPSRANLSPSPQLPHSGSSINLSTQRASPPNTTTRLTTGPPLSVYSTYSFYQLEDSPRSSPTPTISASQLHPNDATLPRTQVQQPAINPSPAPAPSQTQTPQEYLQLGIQHHEANRLKDSASCFEKSAKELGGCGVGMLMWGLTLRHGWGCEKDEKQGFRWLRKAAESAVVDLETARGGMDTSAVRVCVLLLPCAGGRRAFFLFLQTELVIAIYEVAQCFFQGWGVSKDQKMAVVSTVFACSVAWRLTVVLLAELLLGCGPAGRCRRAA
jgi:hypothetical protein